MKTLLNNRPGMLLKTAFPGAGLFFLILIFASPLLNAQGKNPDFSGKWTFNESKSKMGDNGPGGIAITLTITQNDNQMTIVRVSKNRNGDEMTITDNLTLDGKETDNSSGNRTRKSSATWTDGGKSLTIKYHMTFNRNGQDMNVDTNEVCKLQDPKTLVIDFKSKSDRGERAGTRVYDKTM